MNKGLDDRRRCKPTASPTRTIIPDGERHGAQLGRDAKHLGLHLRTNEAQHRPDRVQDPAHRASDEPAEEPREASRGDVRKVRVCRLLRGHPGRTHSVRAGSRHRHRARLWRWRHAHLSRL